MNELVSIIIPCYQQGQYLSEAVESALAQTGARVEVIVVNDGSNDNTEAVAQACGNRIRYIRQENRGLAAARNTGFAAASGEFVQFLDADDLLLPDKIRRQLEVFQAEPEVGVCYTAYRKIEMVTRTEITALPGMRLGQQPLEDFLFRWEKELSIPIHTALFRRGLWKDQKPFHEELLAREDWVLWVELALRGVKFQYLGEVGAIYRTHADSMCADPMRMHLSALHAAQLIRNIIPVAYHKRFEEHAWHLADEWLRQAVFPSVPDYKRMYERVQTSLSRIQNHFLWRLALRIHNILELIYLRRRQVNLQR
ncbi:MAG: glycosyltransferase family 2 protein [Kiritimatiellia bacterium]